MSAQNSSKLHGQEKEPAVNFPAAPGFDLVEGTGTLSGHNPPPREHTFFQTGDIEESYIELIADTLQQMELPVQGAFLQKLLKCLASAEVSEDDSLTHWQGILGRRKELAAQLNRPVTLRTAAVDHFGSAGLVQNPILLEYGDFKRLLHSAATDPLTGFYNRRLFEDYLARELNRASRYSSPFALLLIDLRSFKKVNDTFGHAVGDEVLRSAARACKETIRGSDYPFRIGGDEFALLLPQSDSRSAESLAVRIAQRFEQYAKSVAPSAIVGMDYGIASSPADGENAASLFEAADRNLYANKKNAYGQSEELPGEIGRPQENSEAVRQLRESSEVTPQKPVVVMPVGPSASRQAAGIPPLEATESASRLESPRRHHERFPLEGSWSLGVIQVGAYTELVRILDISSGGVGLLVEGSVKLPEKFHARLNVPIFSSSELALHRMYACHAAEGKQRVGCRFDA